MQQPVHHVRGLIPARAGSTTSTPPGSPRGRAHPRSRGEHAAGGMPDQLAGGSSPLARGARPGSVGGSWCLRLIPARAGSTSDHPPECWAGWAHPRSRGEHRPRLSRTRVGQGSSPLARGAPHAGSWATSGMEAHPRSRGEHFHIPVRFPCRSGSSPLARGARTPPDRRRSVPRAHPRSRGEHFPCDGTVRRVGGSSPLARGARLMGVVSNIGSRLIPARAGSTGTHRGGGRGARAHPRSRGEHPCGPPYFVAGWRLIPARAGSTCSASKCFAIGWAHPRSRGEHLGAATVGAAALPAAGTGSSPLARGAQHQGQAPPLPRGLIPARAGSTVNTGSARSCGSGSSPLARGAPPARCWWRCLGRAHPRSRGEHIIVP